MLSWWWQKKNEATSSAMDFSRPNPKNGHYDVFLSFRGKDTRNGFTANLYRSLQENEIHTFMDVKLTGENINYLFEVIERSKMAVVIYSESFASSDWCLRELDMILQRRKEKKMLIIPIFYKVDVHELKHLSGKTIEYLDKQMSEHSENVVKKWKDAVANLGEVIGLSYKDIHGRYEYDFIAEVIAKIKEKLEECKDIQESCIVKAYSKDIQTQSKIMLPPKVKVQGYVKRWGAVSSLDSHPTQPWVLVGLWNGDMCIWNYETRVEEKSFEGEFAGVDFAKFVSKKHWIMVGIDDDSGYVNVFDYDISQKLREFKAHEGRIQCVAIHPTSSYVLTASDDKLIKLWNWEDDWACWETFEGHSSNVVHVTFEPRDSSSFASISEDGTIKIWSLDSSAAKFTIKGGSGRHNCLEYFVGNDDKLYLLSGSDDKFIRIHDCESKALVQTLEGHTEQIWTILVHPELPIILTGSKDKTVRIWNRNTYELLLVWTCDLGIIYNFQFIKATSEVIIGCGNGMVAIKIVV